MAKIKNCRKYGDGEAITGREGVQFLSIKKIDGSDRKCSPGVEGEVLQKS